MQTRSKSRPKVFGTGLIALDLVMNADAKGPIRSWAGGTCGNVLSILAYLGWDSYPIARMNGDPASLRVKADLKRWGVKLDFASSSPTTHTPIIIQEIRRRKDGVPTHRFSWACPKCGQWLPGFRAITREAVEPVQPKLKGAAVFFMDRLSRAALMLAESAAEAGALVVFEPSGKSDPKLMAEALRLSHVIKYSDQRLSDVDGIIDSDSSVLVEIQTLGAEGLRYRHRLGAHLSKWIHLDAIPAPRVMDTCGSGDWCTAGFLAKIAQRGLRGLMEADAAALQESLKYGQALAAWNCGYEGARGGMYATASKTLEKQVSELLAGKTEQLKLVPMPNRRGSTVSCPACPKTKLSGGKALVSRKSAKKRVSAR